MDNHNTCFSLARHFTIALLVWVEERCSRIIILRHHENNTSNAFSSVLSKLREILEFYFVLYTQHHKSLFSWRLWNPPDGNAVAFVSRFFNRFRDGIFTFNRSEYKHDRILYVTVRFFQIHFPIDHFAERSFYENSSPEYIFPMTFFPNNYFTETPAISRKLKTWLHFHKDSRESGRFLLLI